MAANELAKLTGQLVMQAETEFRLYAVFDYRSKVVMSSPPSLTLIP